MRPADDRFTQDVVFEIDWFIQTFPLYSGQNAPVPSMIGMMKDAEETFRVRKNWLDASPEEREQMLNSGKYEIIQTILTYILKNVLGGSKQPLPTFKHYEKAGVRIVSTGIKEALNRWIKESRGYNKDQGGHQKERLFDLLDKSIDSMDLFDDDCDDYVKEHLRGSDDFQIPPPRTYRTRGRRTKQLPPLRAAIKRNGQQRWGQNAQRRTLRY